MLRPVGIALFLTTAAPAQELPEDYLGRFQLAYAALEEGRLEEAGTLYESCLELAPHNPIVAYHLAALHARAERVGTALQWLERAVEWGYADDAVIAWDEDLAPLRGEARFQEAVSRAAAIEVEPHDATVRWWLPHEADALVSPDGTRAVLPTWDETLLWDPIEKTLVAVLDTPTRAATAFGPEGRVLVTAARSIDITRPRVQAWDPVTGAAHWGVAFPPDTGFVYTRPEIPGAGSPEYWKAFFASVGDDDGPGPSFEGSVGITTTFVFAGWRAHASSRVTVIDERRIALVTYDEVRLVDAASLQLLSTYPMGIGDIRRVALCGSVLVVNGRDRDRIGFLDVDDPGLVWDVPGRLSWSSEDGERLLVQDEASVRILDVRERKIVRELRVQDWISAAAWSRDGERLAIAIGSTVQLWDVATGEPLDLTFDHHDTVLDVAFDGDGNRLATGCFDAIDSGGPTLRIWDVVTGELIASDLPGIWSYVQGVRYDDESSRLLCLLGATPHIEARDADTLELLWAYRGPRGGPIWLRLERKPSGRLFAGGRRESCVLDANDGSLIRVFGHDVTELVPSPDEQRAFAIRHAALDVLDGSSLERLATRVEFRDDGELVFLPSLYFRGTGNGAERTWILIENRATRLAAAVETLYDPRRVAAGAAGVRVRPPSLR